MRRDILVTPLVYRPISREILRMNNKSLEIRHFVFFGNPTTQIGSKIDASTKHAIIVGDILDIPIHLPWKGSK
jgi:hypothetical protein